MNPSPSTTIAFLGLGLMGAGMADNLVKAGYTVAVYNRDPAKAQAFAGRARIAESPRDAARNADIVISMVADDKASQAVWLGEQGALAQLAPGAVCIECSTVTPTWVSTWAAEVAARGGIALDAPVTGSRAHAEAGELNFIVGGSATALEQARAALQAMGRSITLIGPVGSGATFKLINNFLCGTQLAALAEAMAWLDRSGLDRELAFATLVSGSPASPFVKLIGGRMLEGDETLNFHLHLMGKDLAYARAEAQRAGVTLSTAAGAEALLADAVTAGFGERDMSSLYRHVSGRSGGG
jgi:3-hydroxyisobutyrate dehydrogenase